MTVRFSLAALGALTLAACATTEPACRDATPDERALFGALVAHDQERAASMMASSAGAMAERLRNLDPQIESQIFGARMGDRSVRTVLMQPPLCLYDEALSNAERITYVFPAGRFEQLQNPEIPGAQLGTPGYDHAACRFVSEDGQWRLSDACLTTFAASTPAS